MSVPAKLKDRYEIRQVLGQGGMGVVYRAYDSVVKREVALKTLRDAPSPTALQLFYKECDVLASISHPNIVEIFDIGEVEEDNVSKPYFVMPLLPGVSLDRLIAGASQRLTVERCVDIIAQACRGLHAAHERGLVHRDLKPSNLFVMEDDSVKIIDFGLAHIVDSRSSTGQKGTLLYMAPEQIQMKPLSPQTDVYALGVTAYEAFTGRLPFERGTVAEIAQAILNQSPPPASDINASVNQALSRVIHKAMAKQAWHRFASAREFGESLQKALRNDPIEFFDPARLRPRIERASKAFESGDYQFASEILTELEAEGHIDPEMSRLRRQIDQASRKKTILQLLESARRRMEEEEYPLALQKIQEVLQLEPDNADALSLRSRIETGRSQRQIDEWIRLARQHVENFAFSHARQAVQNVLQQSARDTRALALLAEVDRREREYTSGLHEKERLYQAAVDDYHKGEFSTALSKLERVLELDHLAPDQTPKGAGAAYQNLYNQVRSERDAIESAYAEARRHLSDRKFGKAAKVCDDYLIKYPGHALFQALKFDVQEQERQELSSYIAQVDAQVEAEPDLDRRVNILREAVERCPDESHFKRALQLTRDKRDLVNSIVAKATQHEERSQFTEALGQWEILRTIYTQYPGLDFEIERVRKRREQQSRVEAKARWVQQIDAMLDGGDYPRAGGLLENALAEFPGDAELEELAKLVHQAAEVRRQAQKLLEEGQELCSRKMYDEGIDALRRAHLMDLQNPFAKATLVETLAERARAVLDEDWHAAAAIIEEVLGLEPNHPLARSLRTLIDDRRREEYVDQCVSRARQLQASGDVEGALALVEQGLVSYPHALRLTQLRPTLKKALADLQRSQVRQSEVGLPPQGETAAETVAITGERARVSSPGMPPPAPQDFEATIVMPAAGPIPVEPAPAPEPSAAESPAVPFDVREAPVPEPEHVRPLELPPQSAGGRAGQEEEPRKSHAKAIAVAGGIAALLIAGFFGYRLGWFGGETAPPQRPEPAEPSAAASVPPAPVEPAAAKVEPAAEPRPQSPPKPVLQPPPKPPTAKESTVAVTTVPSGASVVFDGNPETACSTPCSLTLAFGRHTATATLPGYRNTLKIYEVPKGPEASVALELVRMTGNVQVATNPPGASIAVNGQRRSEVSPVILTLPVGKYTITVSKEGHKNDEESIEVKDGSFLKLDFTFGK